MNYISVCSGIEAATVSWNKLGWKPLGFSEVDKFASAVLQHHYPNVPNLGDMTNYKEWNINESVDLIIGGTPCQSFSISGLRKGLEDPRGNLALTYIGLLDHFKPKYFIWENVPGVLSSNKGEDFSSFIRAIQEIRYGFAYRTLDAQYFGVPQRRKRVFVVGCSSGDWRSAAEILFESESLSRDTEESRQKGKDSTKETRGSSTTNDEWKKGVAVFDKQRTGVYGKGKKASTACARDYKDATDLVVYESHPNDSRVTDMGETCTTVTARWGTGGNNTPLVNQSVIRRLTPVECERLQGFPCRYTEIPYNNRPHTPDGHRYKALGNSMAVPVIRWLGERIKGIDARSKVRYVGNVNAARQKFVTTREN